MRYCSLCSFLAEGLNLLCACDAHLSILIVCFRYTLYLDTDYYLCRKLCTIIQLVRNIDQFKLNIRSQYVIQYSGIRERDALLYIHT